MNDVMGEVRSTPSGRKKAAPVPKLDPLAWTMSTVEDRIDFINAIGRRDIEDVLDAIEPTSTVQEAEATRSVMAHEPAEPGPVTPEKFETPNTMRGEGGFDPLFQNEVRRTTPEIVPEHMERNTNPQEAVAPLETQNTVRGERAMTANSIRASRRKSVGQRPRFILSKKVCRNLKVQPPVVESPGRRRPGPRDTM